MRDKILHALIHNQKEYISGEVLAEKLNITRSAVWKHINTLKMEGYHIETLNKKGYRLMENKDKLLPGDIQRGLTTKEIGKEIIHFDRIESTNSYAKVIGENKPSGLVILGEEQTAGRGRRGRQWESSKGNGIYMSILLKPKLPPTEGGKLTQIAAAAVCQAIRKLTGLDAKIKWPNDIVINNKKVCGILTEMSAELNEVHYLIVGIGINVNNGSFPDDLINTATSLSIEAGQMMDRRQLVCEILNVFEELYLDYSLKGSIDKSLEVCRQNSAILGRHIRLFQADKERLVKAIEITDEGLLKVQLENGEEETIVSGEVSIRGKAGYV